jgi:hypothetical protein
MKQKSSFRKKTSARRKCSHRLPTPGKGNLGEIGGAALASMTLLEGRTSFTFR